MTTLRVGKYFVGRPGNGALLIDYQYTRVDLFGESFELDDLMTGIMFKF